MPMPAAFDGSVEKVARVSSTCLVSVARNRYSVPCELAGQMVSTLLYPGRVAIVAHDSVVAGQPTLPRLLVEMGQNRRVPGAGDRQLRGQHHRSPSWLHTAPSTSNGLAT